MVLASFVMLLAPVGAAHRWTSADAAIREPPAVAAAEVAILDGATGSLIWGKNAASPVHPASLTKMATALVAIERGRLDDKVLIDVDSRTMRFSTVMGLQPGMQITLEDLLYGLLLPSGNDAALAIGRYIAGDDESFVSLMNDRVRKMGLEKTHFVNPHGLDNDGHLSTASDLAGLARAAMANPTFAAVVGTRQRTVDIDGPTVLTNLNRFLTRFTGADGVKVGYTRRSGPSIAASATRQGRRMIVVVLHSPDPAGESARLLDWAFSKVSYDSAEVRRDGCGVSTEERLCAPAVN